MKIASGSAVRRHDENLHLAFELGKQVRLRHGRHRRATAEDRDPRRRAILTGA